MSIKKSGILLTTLLLSIKAFAYDDEDDIDIDSTLYMTLIGGGIFVVGYIIAQIKFLEKIGGVIYVIGAIIGGLGIVGIALFLLEWAMRTAITMAIYIGAVVLAGYILYQIYLWIVGEKKKIDSNDNSSRK